MPRRSVGMRGLQPLGVEIPIVPDPIITSVSAYLFKTASPVDGVSFTIGADDQPGNSVPGTELGSFSIPAASIVNGAWTTPIQPMPEVELPVGTPFWLTIDRTGTYDLVTRYAVGLGNPGGRGAAGLANTYVGAGFQWRNYNDDFWYTYTNEVLAVRITFSDGTAFDNGYDGASLAFGRGNSNSRCGAAKFHMT